MSHLVLEKSVVSNYEPTVLGTEQRHCWVTLNSVITYLCYWAFSYPYATKRNEAASWCSQRLWMMHTQLVLISPEGKETTPPFGRWAWGFESSDHDYMAYHWERKGLLVDMVNQGTWAKTSVLLPMSQVHHTWTSEVPEIITPWHPSETAQPISATLTLGKNPVLPVCRMGAMTSPCLARMFICREMLKCWGCVGAAQSKKSPHKPWASQKPPYSIINLL